MFQCLGPADAPRTVLRAVLESSCKFRKDGWGRCDPIHEKYEAVKGEQQKNDYDNPAQDRGPRMPHDARLAICIAERPRPPLETGGPVEAGACVQLQGEAT